MPETTATAPPAIHTATTSTPTSSHNHQKKRNKMEDVMVPLNDIRDKKFKRSNSTDLTLSHQGPADTVDYRLQAVCPTEKKNISLWHDISLVHMDSKDAKAEPTYYNFVCEIPKFTRKKFEIATDEEGNPIKQDTKKGKLREFKKGDIFFNYGCFPQTWEDPTHIHPDANGCRGDNDPLDVCEIGARIIQPGDVRPVKVLGILLMIDEGECDWKVVVIDKEDKWAPFLNNIEDVERELPGQLSAIREWYRTYKIPDGKPPNVFGLDEKFMDVEYAVGVINECHEAWEQLLSGEKHRQIDESADDEVKDLVRNLSRNSLFLLADNVDEHKEVRQDNFGEADSGAVFF